MIIDFFDKGTEDIYNGVHIKPIPIDEQLRLVNLIAKTLTKPDADWRETMS